MLAALYTGTGSLFGKLNLCRELRRSRPRPGAQHGLNTRQRSLPTDDIEVSLFSAKASLDDRRMLWNYAEPVWKLKVFLTVLSNRESNRCILVLVTTWTSPSMVRIGGLTCPLAAYGGSIRT